jgi:hypothetical protein
VSTDSSFISIGLLPNAIFIEFETGFFKLTKVEKTNVFSSSVVANERVLVGSNAYLWYLRATTDVPLSKVYLTEVNWTRIGIPDDTCSRLLIFDDREKFHQVSTELKKVTLNDNTDMGGFTLFKVPEVRKETFSFSSL